MYINIICYKIIRFSLPLKQHFLPSTLQINFIFVYIKYLWAKYFKIIHVLYGGDFNGSEKKQQDKQWN